MTNAIRTRLSSTIAVWTLACWSKRFRARQDEPGEQSGQEKELRDQIDVGGRARPEERLHACPK